jgi:hypothetical protein
VWWLVGLLVLAAALVAADRVSRRLAGEQAAARLADVIGVPVDVAVAGTAAGLQALVGRAPRVDLTAHGIPVGDARIDRLTARLVDVRVRLRPPATVRAHDGRFAARLSPASVAALAGLPDVIRLDLTDGGVELRTLGGVTVGASLKIRSGDIVVVPDRGLVGALSQVASQIARVPAEYVIPLSDLPAGARVESLEVTPEALIARGPLDGDRLID